MPNDPMLKDEVLKKAHEFRLIVHYGNIKIYRDLKEYYWGTNMNKKITEFVTKYVVVRWGKFEFFLEVQLL